MGVLSHIAGFTASRLDTTYSGHEDFFMKNFFFLGEFSRMEQHFKGNFV